jgi:frataxin-like iron-binding protein CyaY
MQTFQTFKEFFLTENSIPVIKGSKLLTYPKDYIMDINDEFNDCIEDYEVDIEKSTIDITFMNGTSKIIQTKVINKLKTLK